VSYAPAVLISTQSKSLTRSALLTTTSWLSRGELENERKETLALLQLMHVKLPPELRRTVYQNLVPTHKLDFWVHGNEMLNCIQKSSEGSLSISQTLREYYSRLYYCYEEHVGQDTAQEISAYIYSNACFKLVFVPNGDLGFFFEQDILGTNLNPSEHLRFVELYIPRLLAPHDIYPRPTELDLCLQSTITAFAKLRLGSASLAINVRPVKMGHFSKERVVAVVKVIRSVWNQKKETKRLVLQYHHLVSEVTEPWRWNTIDLSDLLGVSDQQAEQMLEEKSREVVLA
jgi:hypothetical protein